LKPEAQETLLCASELAELCEADLKTIHNWVEQGRIQALRTPGRHLRFRAAEVAHFLRRWGYPLPRALARYEGIQLLLLGRAESLVLLCAASGEGLRLRLVSHPYDALVLLGAEPIDTLVFEPQALGGRVTLPRWLETMRRVLPRVKLFAWGETQGQRLPWGRQFDAPSESSARAIAAALGVATAEEEPPFLPRAAGMGDGA
jgi:excisionase family DNA binding protein